MANDLIIRPQVPATQPKTTLPSLIFGRKPKVIVKRSALYLAAAMVLYFGVIGNLMHRVDADLDFVPTAPIEGGSHAVNMAEALIRRETVDHRWTANDPVFFPTAFHDNMPNFQRGMIRAISRFTLELENQIARLRGSSAIDSDLERASGLLQFPTDVWLFDFDQSLLPIQPADTQYEAASRALRAFNARVALGSAVFETRADALAMTVERMAGELGSRAALVDEHISRDGFIIDPVADDIFYFNKGMAYATYLLLRELGRDFDDMIRTQGLTRVWQQALDSLREASQQRPLVVLNSSGANSLLANHLHLQGFYLKRAILQLDEVARVIRAN
ncbi:MAG: DUF2333 family protein [Paracoccus sp. (in: a-proteobacteria)]|nr:DUF2333 family protein [Paracoccus sp. (in: a-proteobacteria)]